MRRTGRRPVLLAVGVTLVGLAVWLGVAPDGQLFPRLPTAGVTVEAPSGTAVSWGMALPRPRTGQVVLEAIRPLDVSGLDILGVHVCHVTEGAIQGPEKTIGSEGVEVFVYDCALLVTRSWPPVGVALEPVLGTVLDAETGSDVFMIVGARRTSGVGEPATIGAIELTYRRGGRPGSVTFPWFLRLVDALVDPSP